MMQSGTLAWFARHEMRLAWRDLVAMLKGGSRRRGHWAALAILVLVATLHAIAFGVLQPYVGSLLDPDKSTLVALTGSALLTATLSMSQAMETATRSFYARMDLDLILSSPVDARRLFIVRIVAIAVTTTSMSMLLAGPFINTMAILAGPRFLCAYAVLAALGCACAAIAVLLTVLMFRLFGPKRTRLLAQIIAAIVGAGFIIGVQAAAILSYGSMSRMVLFESPAFIAAMPSLASPVWWPARGALGDVGAVIPVVFGSLAFLGCVAVWAAGTFAQNANVVVGLSDPVATAARAPTTFKQRSQAQVLRAKEWALLRRDPWLVSQTLMQVLYLMPPALLLWRDFGSALDRLVVLVPVLVMAAGQLGGGLAWLAISGEDAPDLVATAPIPAGAVLRAKIEAVLVCVSIPIVPFAVVMALMAPKVAVVLLVGAGLAAAGACAIQLCFKTQAKRSMFRRRQTSSRLATFAEAFLSISIAGASGLAAAGLWFAIVPLGVAVGVLATSRALTSASAGSV